MLAPMSPAVPTAGSARSASWWGRSSTEPSLPSELAGKRSRSQKPACLMMSCLNSANDRAMLKLCPWLLARCTSSSMTSWYNRVRVCTLTRTCRLPRTANAVPVADPNIWAGRLRTMGGWINVAALWTTLRAFGLCRAKLCGGAQHVLSVEYAVYVIMYLPQCKLPLHRPGPV